LAPTVVIVSRHDDSGLVPDRYNFIDRVFGEVIAAVSGSLLILPLVPDQAFLTRCLESASGVIFGGSQHDVDPSLYGEEPHPKLGPLDPVRDEVDALLLPMVKDRRMPTLGVCRGFHTINAMLGGDLFQDMPSQRASDLEHYQKEPYEVATHEVTVTAGSSLWRATEKQTLRVNSMHHQGIRTLAPVLEATAFASDGLVEAAESKDPEWYCMGVQWHPEYMWHRDADATAVFRSFIATVDLWHRESSLV
jgi:putative glutamine amidotransferase